jgi:tetratricopeptide (TPR) repeat protein
MARIYTEEGNYQEAEQQLQGISDLDESSHALKAMAYATLADIALRQKKYGVAIGYLTAAIENSNDKHTRVRLTYLLAQTCEEGGEDALSTKYFRDVIRMNPPYDLEFNAGINLAGVADISSGDAEDLKKTLRRMLRDSKNKEYLDQIYFALGELERRQGNIDKAIELYSESARSSTGNNRQKARSYLAMGRYFYSVPSYIKAQSFYDSAMYLINRQFPDYETISRISSDLNEYASFHNIVSTEDSLRRVAMMSPSERDALVSGIIRKLEEEEARSKQDGGSSDRYNMGLYYENEQRSRNSISTEGGWYFYNQAALTFGRTEFRRRWGERRLEDNWRRSNRSRMAFTSQAGENGEAREMNDSAVIAAERTKEFYLRNLPLTDSLMDASLRKSASALLAEGKVLASQLHDTTMAASSFEEASKPGGDDGVRAEALWELYRLLQKKEPARAERRRSELLSLFPGSEYAQILSDPDYVRRQMETSRASGTMYESAYDAYASGRYDEAFAICEKGLKEYGYDPLAPKFMLLQAMSAGAARGEMAYKEKLDTLVARYPGTAEGIRAKEIIEVLRREIPDIRIADDIKIAETIYVTDTLQPHYVLITAGNLSSNLNQMVFDIINFNLDNFSKKNYSSEGTGMEPDFLMITVGTFASPAEAMAYLKSFDPMKEIRGAAEAKLSIFVISRDNLLKFKDDRNIERYRIFYDKTYSPSR